MCRKHDDVQRNLCPAIMKNEFGSSSGALSTGKFRTAVIVEQLFVLHLDTYASSNHRRGSYALHLYNHDSLLPWEGLQQLTVGDCCPLFTTVGQPSSAITCNTTCLSPTGSLPWIKFLGFLPQSSLLTSGMYSGSCLRYDVDCTRSGVIQLRRLVTRQSQCSRRFTPL